VNGPVFKVSGRLETNAEDLEVFLVFDEDKDFQKTEKYKLKAQGVQENELNK
jgi:hypothetical protein